MEEAQKVTELWEGIAVAPQDVSIEETLNFLSDVTQKHNLGIGLVMELPSGEVKMVVPPGDKRIWTMGAIEYLKKAILRG